MTEDCAVWCTFFRLLFLSALEGLFPFLSVAASGSPVLVDRMGGRDGTSVLWVGNSQVLDIATHCEVLDIATHYAE